MWCLSVGLRTEGAPGPGREAGVWGREGPAVPVSTGQICQHSHICTLKRMKFAVIKFIMACVIESRGSHSANHIFFCQLNTPQTEIQSPRRHEEKELTQISISAAVSIIQSCSALWLKILPVSIFCLQTASLASPTTPGETSSCQIFFLSDLRIPTFLDSNYPPLLFVPLHFLITVQPLFSSTFAVPWCMFSHFPVLNTLLLKLLIQPFILTITWLESRSFLCSTNS